MNKIPTVFLRDPDDMKHLLREVHPDCQWVLDGEGIGTRKYDGTCIQIRRDGMGIKVYARREFKDGQREPDGFVFIEYDNATKKTVGWVRAEGGQWWPYLEEALSERDKVWLPGTYELVGPKINGNPEGFDSHRLIAHSDAEISLDDRDHNLRDYDAIADLVLELKRQNGWEGLVYHHEDGRMAKVKARDFG